MQLFCSAFGCSLQTAEFYNQDKYQHTREKMAIVIINSEILTQENSNPIFDWMENKKLEIFELVESLKKIEFLKAHSKVNNDLNSFHFPNDDYQSV